jgi:hypothetical protein
MGIVETVVADANLDIEDPLLVKIAELQGAEGSGDLCCF